MKKDESPGTPMSVFSTKYAVIQDDEDGPPPVSRPDVMSWTERVAMAASFSREVWLAFGITVLASFSYVCFTCVIVLHLSEAFSYTDEEASWIFAINGLLGVVLSFGVGWIVDWLGVKVSCLLGCSMMFAGRIVLALFTSKALVLLSMFFLLPIGGSPFLIPALATCITRSTNQSNRSFAFSMYVVSRCAGTLIAAPVVDGIRRWFSVDQVHWVDNEYRFIMLLASIGNFMTIVLAMMIRSHKVSLDANDQQAQQRNQSSKKPWILVHEMMTSSQMWKFLLFNAALVGMSCLHRHVEATLPKYMVRTMGDDVPFASVIGLRSLFTLFLIPLLSAVPYFIGLFDSMLLASTLCACSVLFMLHVSLWTSVAFIALLAVGEAVLEPRMIEYVCTAAPKGREGTYVVLSNLPSLLSRVMVGFVSGWLLSTRCSDSATPENKQCDVVGVWLVVFAMAAITPLSLLFLRPWLINENSNPSIDKPLERVNSVIEPLTMPTSPLSDVMSPRLHQMRSPLLHTPFVGTPHTPFVGTPSASYHHL